MVDRAGRRQISNEALPSVAALLREVLSISHPCAEWSSQSLRTSGESTDDNPRFGDVDDNPEFYEVRNEGTASRALSQRAWCAAIAASYWLLLKVLKQMRIVGMLRPANSAISVSSAATRCFLQLVVVARLPFTSNCCKLHTSQGELLRCVPT